MNRKLFWQSKFKIIQPIPPFLHPPWAQPTPITSNHIYQHHNVSQFTQAKIENEKWTNERASAAVLVSKVQLNFFFFWSGNFFLGIFFILFLFLIQQPRHVVVTFALTWFYIRAGFSSSFSSSSTSLSLS